MNQDSLEEWVTVPPRKKVERKVPDAKKAKVSPKARSRSPSKKNSVPAAPPVPVPVPDADKANAKKNAKKNKGVKVNSRDAMVALIQSILENTPSGQIGIPAIGEKITSSTKSSWNKKFKSKFGSLSEFLSSQPELTVTDDQVCLKKVAASPKKPAAPKKPAHAKSPTAAVIPAAVVPVAVVPVAAPVIGTKSKKSKQKPVAAATIASALLVPRSPTRKAKKMQVAKGSSSGIVLKTISVAMLLVAVSVLTLVSVGVIDMAQITSLLQSKVRSASGN